MIRLIDHVADPSIPWVTYYDEDAGERTELSARTTQNWVDKTSNLLVDDLDTETGTRVRIYQTSHWQTLVWILACWQIGATLCSARADIGVYGPGHVYEAERHEAAGDEPIRAALSLSPLALPFETQPDGYIDFNAEVRAQPDDFFAIDEAATSAPAVDTSMTQITYADLLNTRPIHDRVQLIPDTLTRDVELVRGLVSGGGSVVIVSGASQQRSAEIAATERAKMIPTEDALDSSRSG